MSFGKIRRAVMLAELGVLAAGGHTSSGGLGSREQLELMYTWLQERVKYPVWNALPHTVFFLHEIR